jgi:hypothetical protein
VPHHGPKRSRRGRITANSAADRGGGIWANITVSSTTIGVRAADGTST